MNIPPKALAGALRRKLLLGDAVAAVAQPIARAIDKRLGTDIEHCTGCGKRRKWLNGGSPES